MDFRHRDCVRSPRMISMHFRRLSRTVLLAALVIATCGGGFAGASPADPNDLHRRSARNAVWPISEPAGRGAADSNGSTMQSDSPNRGPAAAVTAAISTGGDFVAVTAGGGYNNRGGHSCGLRSDSTIICWGDNSALQASPPAIDFSAVSAGGHFSCGLTTGEFQFLVCWGAGMEWDGRRGDYVTAVDAGGVHYCDLYRYGSPRGDGTYQNLGCAGSDSHGQTWQEYLPRGDDFKAVAAGGYHNCAVRGDDTVECWGLNSDGQADAPGGSFRSVAAGNRHSCGLRTDRAVVCWGLNGDGQADAPGGSFKAVAAGGGQSGGGHSCGLRTDGAVVCWGLNGDGQADAPGGSFKAVAAGYRHSCGLRTDGTVVCWGSDAHGEASAPGVEALAFSDVDGRSVHHPAIEALASQGVFDGTECGPRSFCPGEAIDRKTMAVWMVRVIDGENPAALSATRFSDVDAESFHAPFVERMAQLGITRGCGDGTRFCPDRPTTRAEMAVFLSRAYDLADDGPFPGVLIAHEAGPEPGFSDVPADAWYAADVVRLAASGITRGCGDGTRFCPDRTTTRAEMATFLWRAKNRKNDVTEVRREGIITAGGRHSCAVLADRTAACWGAHTHGQSHVPEGRFVAVSAGWRHSCGLRVDQTVACWGRKLWRAADPPAGQFLAVSAGGRHSCGLRVDQSVACWGSNDDGQSHAPAGQFLAVSAGGRHSCGLRVDQTVACWGSNDDGQSYAPAGQFLAVSAGGRHSCGLRVDKSVACWGSDGGAADPPVGRFVAVSAGTALSCGLRVDKSVACWGSDGGAADPPVGRFVAVSAGAHWCGLRVDQSVACSGGPFDLRGFESALMPISAGCRTATGGSGRPGQPADARVTLIRALDDHGWLTHPATVGWADPCTGGAPHHYVIQWRRGHQNYDASREHTVQANRTKKVYSFDIPDVEAYAFRVIGINDEGQTRSAETIIPTPANVLRSTAEEIVVKFQDDYPWLTDVWTYVNSPDFRFSVAHCDFIPGGGCASASSLFLTASFRVVWSDDPSEDLSPWALEMSQWALDSIAPSAGIIVHEMAHIYTLFAPSGDTAAVVAGLLYFHTLPDENSRIGWGSLGDEYYADMAEYLMQRGGSAREDYLYYWSTYPPMGNGEPSQEAYEVARSVFIDQAVPRWFYDTYRSPDGSWNTDALNRDFDSLGWPSEWRDVLYKFVQ